MKYKQNNVQIWFLDEDLQKSAEYLSNIALNKSIEGAFAAMLNARFYFIGIRTKKIYDYYFQKDRRSETMDRFFPNWPFRPKPSMKYYTSRASKWTRMCFEHFEYVRRYFDIMLTEYEHRTSRRHGLSKFSDWLSCDAPYIKIPMGNLRKITLPWKSLKKEWRRTDIIEGYRLQYMDTFCWGDPIKAYLSSNRDVPDFVVRHFHLDTQSMIT